MAQLNDKKLLRLIKYLPAIIVALAALAINSVVIRDTQKEAQVSIDSLRYEFIDREKNHNQRDVNKHIESITHERHSAVEQLKKVAQSRVHEAHTTALHIYKTNQHKPEQDVKEMISDALATIRFFENRGYFFIFQMDGINVMHALKPHIQGQSEWETQDVMGTYILQEHIRLIQEQGGEAFYRWWYQKPGEPVDLEFEKIGYGKYFAPFDWFIGTGEYTANVEQDIQSRIVSRVSNFNNIRNDQIFILDRTGKVLAHQNERFKDRSIFELTNITQSEFSQFLNSDSSQGMHVEFETTIPDEEHKHIGYVQTFEPWGWIVGQSFYKFDIEEKLLTTQRELDGINNAKLTKILLLSLLSTALIVGLSLYVGHIIAKRFQRFQKRIEADFEQLNVAKNKLQHMAMFDSLTGLPNRVSFIKTLTKSMTQCEEKKVKLAVIFVDLDDFKKVNDLYGHAYGDNLLISISRQFENLLGDDDSVCRFGGDEFIFCFPNLSNETDALLKVKLIQKVFENEFVIDGKHLTTNCSLGVSIYPTDSIDAHELITKSDIVLYKSKAIGKNSYMFFCDKINQEVKYNYQLEEQLRYALQRDEITTVYQPQLELNSNRIVSIEALARWKNKTLGNVPPLHFIEIAEETGLIHKIGLFIFRQACLDINQLATLGHHDINVSINVSPKQLTHKDFVHSIVAITQETGINNQQVTIEITENVLIADVNKALPILNEIRELGFGISLDDFGTGYSSLHYLNTLPITELKIDQGFIKQMSESQQTNSLIKAILAIGEAYQIQIVAEGVETKAQHDLLLEYGCHLNQGYFYSRPVPIAEIQEQLAA
jgi:diguanylate cyclase (GGDEF)-like protein